MRSFDKCYNEAKKGIEKENGEAIHLLLGNGFSIGIHGEFKYTVLLDEMKKVQADNIKPLSDLFNELQTSDFEKVMAAIYHVKSILTILEIKNVDTTKLDDYLELIKESFIKTLSNIHPKSWSEIEKDFQIYTDFLRKFENLFTTNYDILLYWLVNKIIEKEKPPTFKDGFGGVHGNLIYKRPDDQNVFFLHGGLHFYKEYWEIIKINNDEKSIIESTKERIKKDNYPIIVLELTFRTI